MKSILFTLFAALFIGNANTQGFKENKFQATEKFIDLATGVRLQYAEQGDAEGTLVIFLHGYTDSWHSFETVLPQLPSGIHAIVLTQRGHGNSSKPADHYRPKDFVEDVAAFMEQKGLGSAFIVGHSMGGVIAQQFAVDHPELTRGIVLLSTDASFKDNPGLPEFNMEINKLSDPISYKFADEFQRATCARPIDTSYYGLLVRESLKMPALVWKSVMNGILEADLRKDIKRIQVPALILWGDEDAFVSRIDQQILVQGIQQSTFITYNGTGHALHWEEPSRFSRDLLRFLAQVRAMKMVASLR